jgi:hypothetical protein
MLQISAIMQDADLIGRERSARTLRIPYPEKSHSSNRQDADDGLQIGVEEQTSPSLPHDADIQIATERAETRSQTGGETGGLEMDHDYICQ